MNADEISRALAATLSPDLKQRRAAESLLKNYRAVAGFSTLLLQLVEQHCIPNASTHSALIRSSAHLSECVRASPNNNITRVGSGILQKSHL